MNTNVCQYFYKCFLLLQVLLIAFTSKAQYIQPQFDNGKWEMLLNKIFYTNTLDANTTQQFQYRKSITANNYNNTNYLVLKLKNPTNLADSIQYFCGHWLNFKAYNYRNNAAKPLLVSNVYNTAINNYIPLLTITIPPNDSVTIIIEPLLHKFNYNFVNPHLIKYGYANEFGYAYYVTNQKIYLNITYLFLGILVAVFLYAYISWYLQRKQEYFFYGNYVLFFIIYFQIRIYFIYQTDYSIVRHNLFAVHFLLVVGYVFYASFINAFLQLKNVHKGLYNLIKVFNLFLLVYLVADFVAIYYTTNVSYVINAFLYIRFTLLLFSLFIAIKLAILNSRLSIYISVGIILLFTCGLISLLYTTLEMQSGKYYNFFDMRITWYQIGIFVELVLFTIALQYKAGLLTKETLLYSEKLKIENEKKEFENYKLVLSTKDVERTRIAQEIHDDIGSGLTSIRLLSEIAIEKNKTAPLVEIEKISETSSELIENMNEIIWSINAKNDNLPNLIAYIRRYVVTYFEYSDTIFVKTKITDSIPSIDINGEFRRSVFLTIKEALHNIVKHAGATFITLDVQFENNDLLITVYDNGIGIDFEKISPFSNGLKNMKERIESHKGVLTIAKKNGTVVALKLPLLTTT